jgi:MFS family permease
MEKEDKKFSFYGIFVWFLSILFFLYEYCVRIIPATISNHIIADLKVSAEQFALISSAYYIAYSSMQIPVGILLDRYSIRLFLGGAAMICSLGVLGFGLSETFVSCLVSRFLTGLGSSFGFVAVLIIALNWFPHRHFGFLGGIAQLLGSAGPILAGDPITYFMRKTNNNWHAIFLAIGFFCFALSFLIALFVRSKPKESTGEVIFLPKEQPLSKRLRALIKIPQFWLVLPYGGLIYVSLPFMGAYWGTLYLEAKAFEPSAAALIVSMSWIGIAVGSPIIGRLSDRSKRRKPFLVGLGAIGAIASFLVVFPPVESKIAFAALFFALGFSASGQSLSFATIVEQVPVELQGTAIGANNTAVMLVAAVLPPAVSMLIPVREAGYQGFIASDFTMSFLAMPICCSLAALIALFWIRETFCHQQHTVYYGAPK